MKKTEQTDRKLPEHIAIIMDGNGRWAKKRALPRSAGHSAGSSNFKTISRYCNKIGIKHLTVYAFSTENWKRPGDEVNAIMDILRKYLKDSKQFIKENIRLDFIGDLQKLPDDIQEQIKVTEAGCDGATGLRLHIAMNYGGRDEIMNAVRSLAQDVKAGDILPSHITEEMLESKLYTVGIPDVDLLIRTSGEYRTSNFLMWQSSYAELWFNDVLWPDFKAKHLEAAIDDYNNRDRRMGGI